ncbi:HxxPF-repeated domain-containing protein [Kibdelosporangium aridum]|uniref:HxxPF-repeated domain-containing protein n=1 Tax=Kibdelosporangium aridum TaxID=2030 RepID=A0A1Y5X8H1_KIBAR|nr:HxxPF-repeated domain-containing protein [Kibdelosporangium aridum]
MGNAVTDNAIWKLATPAQQGIWVLDKDDKLRPTYLIPTVLEFTGGVDNAILAESAQAALGRHPALRSRFRLDTTTLRVEYRTDGPAGEVGFIDALADGWTAEELDRLVDMLCWTPFDLATEPQARGEVIKADENTTLLVLTMHHISFDGWSRHLLVNEVIANYQAISRGERPATTMSIDPADVVVPPQPDAERVAEAVERLRGAPMTVELPYDRRPAHASVLGANLSVELDEELTGKVMAVAGQEGCTPFMTAVALLAGTLSRCSGQRDFLFALGWPGREDPATADAIGMFMCTLVLRVRFDDSTTWRELLRNARAGAMEAFMDSDVPLDSIAAALNPGRQVLWPPLTPVLVNVDDLPLELPLAPGVTGRYRLDGPVYTKYDLDLFVRLDQSGSGSRMTLAIDYPTDLFDQPTIETLLSGLRRSAVDLAYSTEEPFRVRPADR